MKQLSRILPAYAFDISGVCSALYELDGLVVMHDASGCNSSYTTFDEPRWYDVDSMIYGSGLDETDAMLGGDDRLIGDVVRAAADLHPRFIAVAGGPVPMMIGTDFKGIARVIEKRTGIPTFGFFTNGLHVYTYGASLAFEALADRIVLPAKSGKDDATGFAAGAAKPAPGSERAVNLLGATPLDFSVGENLPALRRLFEARGFAVNAVWAMGGTLDEIARAGDAAVNVVLSACGLRAAKALRGAFGTPWVAGLPVGGAAADALFNLIGAAARDGENKILQAPVPDTSVPGTPASDTPVPDTSVLIIGEQVYANALRFCLRAEYGLGAVRTLCPLDPPEELLLPGDSADEAEEDIEGAMARAALIVADPLYRHLLPEGFAGRFVEMPHEALSGRLYRSEAPCVVGEAVHAHLQKFGLERVG